LLISSHQFPKVIVDIGDTFVASDKRGPNQNICLGESGRELLDDGFHSAVNTLSMVTASTLIASY